MKDGVTQGIVLVIIWVLFAVGLTLVAEVRANESPELAYAAKLRLSTATTEFVAVDFATTHVPGQRTEKITERNWQQHPKIKAIRRLVSSVNAGLKKGAFKTSERRFESCDRGEYFGRKRIARNTQGTVAWYEDYFEGEDRTYDFHYYYDPSGRLRFVVAFANAANGTKEQHRIYFDEDGKRIWEAHKSLAGPGCPGCFVNPEPDDGLAFDPTKAFASNQGCKEIAK